MKSKARKFNKEDPKVYSFFYEEQGTAAIEYALIISFLGIVIVFSLNAVGDTLVGIFSKFENSLSSVQFTDRSLKRDL